MIEIVEKLFNLWNDNNVVYCHWKGNSHIEDSITGKSDFDILISEDTIEEGCKLLKKADYLLCKTQVEARFPGIQDWLGMDKTTGIMVHIHLHQFMIAGHAGVMEYILPWEKLVLSTRIKDEKTNIYQINPSLELILLFTRIGIEHSSKKLKKIKGGYELKEKTLEEITYLKDRFEERAIKEYARILYPNCYDEFLKLLNIPILGAKEINRLSAIMRKACSKWLRFNKFVLRFVIVYKIITQKVRWYYYRSGGDVVYKKVPSIAHGLNVVFLGQDGAGKTTITQAIIKWLGWKLDVHYVYMGNGDNYSSWKKYISKKMPDKGMFKYINAVLNLLDLKDLRKKAYRNIKKAHHLSSKGAIIVYDRYPQMEFANICDGPKIRYLLEKETKGFITNLLMPVAVKEEMYIQKIIAYTPDIVIKLTLPPEESLRRKPHENLERVKIKHEIVNSLNFEHSDVYTIDATMPIDQELVLIKRIIWQHIQK